jgi:hypothetical protein
MTQHGFIRSNLSKYILIKTNTSFRLQAIQQGRATLSGNLGTTTSSWVSPSFYTERWEAERINTHSQEFTLYNLQREPKR